jgi:hypothetical protein
VSSVALDVPSERTFERWSDATCGIQGATDGGDSTLDEG